MHEKEPLVSIVIPSYNHAEFVQESIQSVIDQDYSNIELIIIDDGSRDNSIEEITKTISRCKKRFTRFEFRHRSNKGLAATLNEALDWCTGEYFVALASDDVMKPHKTTCQVAYLEGNQDAQGVFGGVEIINSQKKLHEKFRFKNKYTFEQILTHKHYLPAPTQMLRIESVRSVGGYRCDLIIEDWSMWLLLTKEGGTLDYLPKIFANYRRHGDNLSSKREIMWKGVMQVLDEYKENPKYKKALSNLMIIEAHSNLAISKKSAAGWAFSAFTNDPTTLFSRSFIWFTIKFLSVC